MKYRQLLCACAALWASALSAQTHWTCDYRQYRNDMTLYFSLQRDGASVEGRGHYEVAAFVGDECRGVGEYVLATGTNGTQLDYGYLRIYSNAEAGETVTLRYYDAAKGGEAVLKTFNVPFEAGSVVGMPSSTHKVMLLSDGDVNADGKIDTQDAIKVTQQYLGKKPTDYTGIVADVNGDGRVDTQDVIQIVKIYLKKQ